MSEVNEPFRVDIRQEKNNFRDQSMIGFRDFNPKQNFDSCLNNNFSNDYNDEDSYFDDFDLDNNQKTSK